MSKARTWVVMTALLVGAVFAGGWFLAVTPQRGEASDLRGQTVSQDQSNELLVAKIAQLQAQAKNLPAQKAMLAELRAHVPAELGLPALVRTIDRAAAGTGVDVVSISPGAPVALVVQQPSSVPTAGPTAAGTQETRPTAAAPASADVVTVPIVLVTTGSYAETTAFVNKLEGFPRSFLVTDFTLENPDADNGGRTLKLTLNGQVFVAAGAQTTAAPSTAPAN